METVARIHRKRVFKVTQSRFRSVHSARAECDLVTTHEGVACVVKAQILRDQGRQLLGQLGRNRSARMTTTPAAETVAKPNSILVRQERCDRSAIAIFYKPKTITIG